MARLIKGDALSSDLRRQVLARYVMRHHSAIWQNSDEVWLAQHAFYVTKDGRLDERYRHCEPAYLAD